MRTPIFAFALIVTGMAGSLQAARPSRHHHAPAVHPAQASTHKVRRGETAARIARDHGLSLAELEAINPRLNLGRLSAGATVKVRGAVRQAVSERHAVSERQTVPGEARNREPMPPLPATPAPGPTSLTHLEGILPVTIRDLSATTEGTAPRPEALAGIQPVLPPYEAPQLPAALPPVGFEPADPNHLDLLWPVETRTVSSAWGPRMRSKTIRMRKSRRRIQYRGSHKGVDLTAPSGTDVFAALDGQVVAVGTQKGYGNFVKIDHGNGIETLYGHHRANFVREGEIVHRGQKIAEVGRTGNATGPHLHFELRRDGAAQNPLPYLNDVEEVPADQIAQNETVAPPATRR